MNHINADSLGGEEGMLLQQLAQGRVDAFSILYKRYQPKLSRFLYPFREVEAPGEVIQDIFLKIWEKREVLPAIRSFEQYLYRMAKNRLIDLKKSNQARKDRETGAGKAGRVDAGTTFESVEYKEVHAVALKAIGALTERQQTIYRLRVFEDRSLDEISEELSLSKAVVIKQLYLATRFIRERLKPFQHLDIVVVISLSGQLLKNLLK